MKKLIIIGAQTPTIVRIIDDINNITKDSIKIIGFIDNDISKHGKKFMSYKIIGGSDSIKQFDKKDIFLINTISRSTSTRKETTIYFENLGYRFTNIIHPSVNLEYVTLGCGVYIQENAIIQPKAHISNHVIVSSGSTVAHNSHIGEYVFIGPSVYICGRVNIKKMCYLSVGAKIVPEVTIGENSLIAAGSVVVKDVPKNVKLKGIPAREY